MQLVPGNVVLMKNDAYQGKWKVKDQWSETEYVVVRQVADGIPTDEVKDEAGNVETVHRNTISRGCPSEGHHALGGWHAALRRECCSIHPCGKYLTGGRERFTRGILGWG